MTDYFALLNEPRRPWVEGELLKQKFLSLSAELHPDRVHSADEPERQAASNRFADFNAAYNCLAAPKSRLFHLLELERGARPAEVEQIPGALADWFAEVATLCRDADRFLAEKAKSASPLLQVQFFEGSQEWIERLNGLAKKLGAFHGELVEKLKSLDTQWMAPDCQRDRVLNDLEVLYRLFGYFNRWNSQIQERIVQLSV